MENLQASMVEFHQQLKKGVIQKAHKGLLDFMLGLRTYFSKAHPEYALSGLYQGYMDMTYFALVSTSLKQRNLKIAIVFNYEAFRFEAWLSAVNKQVQMKYWKLFKENEWDLYKLVPAPKGNDSIVEHVLADEPNFDDLEGLTRQIEEETMRFIQDVEGFLESRGG